MQSSIMRRREDARMNCNKNVLRIVADTAKRFHWLAAGVLLAVVGSVVTTLIPPLVLGTVVDQLTAGAAIPVSLVVLYFALIALSGVLESSRESLLIVFGQKITHALRSKLSEKLTRLSADSLNQQEPGSVVARFVGDVNTVETLFTSGIISMFADACKIVSILIIVWTKTKGLAVLLLLLLPFIFLFTRSVQKKTLTAQLANRAAVSRATNHVPESLRCIRTIHTLGKEQYMEKRYDDYIGQSYQAIEKTNFYDSIYSPVILILNAIIVAGVMLLSASGDPTILTFFGMSVGTSVTIINYITQIFAPLESLGMEIQTIQSAVAGARRIDGFLAQPERCTAESVPTETPDYPCVELRNVTFGYDENTVLHNVSFCVNSGEQVTITGRTGAGKSTMFKLLLGLYQPQSGEVLINGMSASAIADSAKRRIFGYVDQSFHMVPGTIKDQITLFDQSITDEMVQSAARLTGLHETICNLEHGYETECAPALLSQGQWQLLSIARAVAAKPQILLLDEITANLDVETERAVLKALRNVSADRTVVSISHRIYECEGGRMISI